MFFSSVWGYCYRMWAKMGPKDVLCVCVCSFLSLPAAAAVRSIWKRRASWCSSVWPWPPTLDACWICRWCIHLFFPPVLLDFRYLNSNLCLYPMEAVFWNVRVTSLRTWPDCMFLKSVQQSLTGYFKRFCGNLWHLSPRLRVRTWFMLCDRHIPQHSITYLPSYLLT